MTSFTSNCYSLWCISVWITSSENEVSVIWWISFYLPKFTGCHMTCSPIEPLKTMQTSAGTNEPHGDNGMWWHVRTQPAYEEGWPWPLHALMFPHGLPFFAGEVTHQAFDDTSEYNKDGMKLLLTHCTNKVLASIRNVSVLQVKGLNIVLC